MTKSTEEALAEKETLSFVNQVSGTEEPGTLIGFDIVRGEDGIMVFPIRERPVSIAGKDGNMYLVISAKWGDGFRLPKHSDVVANYEDALEAMIFSMEDSQEKHK